MRATVTVEYDTGGPVETLSSYDTLDPTLCADIDADNIKDDPAVLVDLLEYGYTVEVIALDDE